MPGGLLHDAGRVDGGVRGVNQLGEGMPLEGLQLEARRRLQPESAGGLIAAAICGTDPVSTLINKALLPVDHTCAPPESLYLKADYDMGWPLAGFNSTTRFVEQFQVLVNGDAKLVTAALNAAMKDVSATPPNARYYVGEATGGKVVSILWTARSSMGWRQMLMADASLAMGSIAFIFLFVWFHTGSIVLTLVGMYEILMSLPLALFFYCVVGGQQNVSFLAVVSIYLILCIGADDIFVFVDCWKATKYAPPHISGSLESRFVVAYRQAASAMFSTTSTTVICLVCAAFMPIPQLASFAIFAALAVTLDYCLVITWFPAALLAYEKYCGGAAAASSASRPSAARAPPPATTGSRATRRRRGAWCASCATSSRPRSTKTATCPSSRWCCSPRVRSARASRSRGRARTWSSWRRSRRRASARRS